ncbi:unnamed protein product [Cunninghamella blakesleeana]
MSVYNHRSMVPAPSNKFVEMLDNIQLEFDQLSQEAYICKSQRDDFELKMNSQIKEMSNFQQSLLELERTQQGLKKHYEEEIARLRQLLEQAQSRNGNNHSLPNRNNPKSSNPSNIPTPSPHYAPPPNIGSGSNNFSGITNAHGNSNSNNNHGPPQMNEPSSHHPSFPLPPHSPSTTQNPTSFMNESPIITQIDSGPNTSGYPYSHQPPPSSQQQRGPGTPTSQPSPLINNDIKRKPGPSPSNQQLTPNRSSNMSSKNSFGGFGDLDPDGVPPNMKIEGSDWFALFNPKVPRYLTVGLELTLEHKSVVCCVKFSQDGRFLATGCNRSTYIYEVATGQKVCVLQDDSVAGDSDLYIRSVCFSPDGKYLATGAEDKLIRIWDIAQRRIQFQLSGHEQDIYSLDFSRDGRIIVSGSGDRTARIWSMADGKLLHKLVIKDVDPKDPGVTSVAISPNNRLVAAGSLDKMVRVWDTYDGTLLDQLEGHKDSVYSVAFMPDGHTLVSGSLDKTLKLWQLSNSNEHRYGNDRDHSRNPCITTFVGHKDFVLSVACTPDGRWVVSGSKDRGVQFWDPRTGQTQFMLQGHKNSVISVAVSPSGKPLFATGSGDNRARIWSYDLVA